VQNTQVEPHNITLKKKTKNTFSNLLHRVRNLTLNLRKNVSESQIPTIKVIWKRVSKLSGRQSNLFEYKFTMSDVILSFCYVL
jgi:hypothetical protein